MNYSSSKPTNSAFAATSTTHSTSLSSVSSTYTTLSGLSSSSSYYRGGSVGSLSLASSLTSIEDLQAIPAYEDWNYVAPHAYNDDCSLAHGKRRRRRPLRERLGAIWRDLRGYAADFVHEVSLYNLVVGVVFCYYAWILLLALSGLGTQLNYVDDSRCKVLLAAQPFVNASSGQGSRSSAHPHVGP